MGRRNRIAPLIGTDWLKSRGWREGKDGLWRTDLFGGAFSFSNAIKRQNRLEHPAVPCHGRYSDHVGSNHNIPVSSGYRSPEYEYNMEQHWWDETPQAVMTLPRVVAHHDMPSQSVVLQTEMAVSGSVLLSADRHALIQNIAQRVAHDLVHKLEKLETKEEKESAVRLQQAVIEQEYRSDTPALDRLHREVEKVCNHA